MLEGFGAAVVKQEGAAAVPFDAAYPVGRAGPETHWIELRLEEGWTRERVHHEVEDWLQSHGWTTKPTRNPWI